MGNIPIRCRDDTVPESHLLGWVRGLQHRYFSAPGAGSRDSSSFGVNSVCGGCKGMTSTLSFLFTAVSLGLWLQLAL